MKFPAIFLGHGSPMNALENNTFTVFLSNLGKELVPPKAIGVISAHWQTTGTCISCQTEPKQIYDFTGFPQELYKIRYSPPGTPEIATKIIENSNYMISGNDFWGLDHAAWTLLKHMYPEANIPVFEISLDRNKRPREHYETGKKLRYLREEGILIIGSGNIVHNLSEIKYGIYDTAFSWASEFNEIVTSKLLNKDFDHLIDFHLLGNSSHLSVPTEEHYLPLLYILGMFEEKEKCTILFNEIQHGSISMLSLKTDI